MRQKTIHKAEVHHAASCVNHPLESLDKHSKSKLVPSYLSLKLKKTRERLHRANTTKSRYHWFWHIFVFKVQLDLYKVANYAGMGQFLGMVGITPDILVGITPDILVGITPDLVGITPDLVGITPDLVGITPDWWELLQIWWELLQIFWWELLQIWWELLQIFWRESLHIFSLISMLMQ